VLLGQSRAGVQKRERHHGSSPVSLGCRFVWHYQQ
jgi:hypothetical protein